MAADSAFPGVRLHVVTSRPPEASPLAAEKSGELAMARRAKTVEDLKALDDSAGRAGGGNVQFSPAGDDARAAPQRERSEPQERTANKEKKEKKDKKDKERSKDRDEKKERRAAKTSEQDAELLEQERQRKRLEVKPRPSRQMSVSVVTSLTSDYVGRQPRQSQPSQQQPSRASGMPPSLPVQRTRPAPSSSTASGASSSRASSNADELSPAPGQSTSSAPRGRFFGRPMEELSTPSKEGQAAPTSLFSTRTSLGHVPAILYALAEVVYRRGVKGSVHGLFRISGRAPRIAELRAALDSLPAGELKAQVERLVDTEDIHVVTGLFKLLLREQPEPLVPSSFRCLTDSGEQEDRLLQGRTLISLMTAKHRASFFYVFELLARVRDEKELRMSSTALGVVFGPVVMRVNETDLAQFHIASAVVEAIIDHFLALTVPTPSSLLSPRGSRIRMAALDQSRGRLSHSQSPPPRVDSADAIARPRQGGSGGLFASPSRQSAEAADVAKWTPAEVGQWVAQLGLAAYAPAFREHQVDGQALLELDRFDLQDMGVRLVGHQKTILRNVRTLVSAD